MFRVPYYYPAFEPGQQVFTLGQGGPQSHMGLQAMQPRTYPTVYNVPLWGIGAMPRQVIGPTLPVVSNQWSLWDQISQLEIAGLFKSPIGG